MFFFRSGECLGERIARLEAEIAVKNIQIEVLKKALEKSESEVLK
jgi:hypothetical protein